jgi:hypothetical protein
MNVHMHTAVGHGRSENQGNIFVVKNSILVISIEKKCRLELVQLCIVV